MTTARLTSRNHGLDTLRALAIVLVYMYHYAIFVSHDRGFGFASEVGWVGVDLFFALSGYLIGNQIFAAMRSESGLSLPRFYGRRFLRTLPNFYVVLALYYWLPGFRGTSELLPAWRFLSFTQNYQLMPGTAFSHAWSLCIEEQFYLLLPAAALLVAAGRSPRRVAWTVMVSLLVTGIALREMIWQDLVDNHVRGTLHFYQDIYYSSFCRLDELVAGVALAMLKNYHAGVWRRLTAHGNAMFAAGAGLAAATLWLLMQDQESQFSAVFGYPVLALAFALLILSALSERSLLRTTRVPGAASVALWSYAIYLTHKQVCILAGEQLEKMGVGVGSAAGMAMAAVLSLAAGWLLFRVVETPFMALRQRWLPSNAHAAAADAALSSLLR